MSDTTYQATYAFTARAATPEELAARFMDPNRPKTEAEHWAVREIEKLRADLATQQSCCDGAAAQDAHVRQEREEHRAKVAKLRAGIERLREALQESACACSSIRECVSECAKDGKCPHLIARNALEGKP